jgi:hypothetical protein
LLAVLGIAGTNAKGARGEKTRARSRGKEEKGNHIFFLKKMNT